jgi:alkyl sulfatase BDS1-like metallo-beta-lactamase superfamily hydrolase
VSDHRPAESSTKAANGRVLQQLPFGDETDFENARRGLISPSSGQITAADGRVVWDLDLWSFLDGDAPDTANPSLWRQGRLVAIAGVFEVVDGVYQVRGYDLSVTSFLRTDAGWVVVDPLLTEETMAAALQKVTEHVDDRPVVGVIYTHSHVDHYGGVRAVVTDEDVASGQVRIIAPVGFMDEAISENVMLGNAMSRRSSYMYGNLVGWNAEAGLGAGLGQLTSTGGVTLIPPTDIVSETGQELTIDGLRIQFQHTPGAEAPSELCFYLPDRKALCMAEIATHTLHNVYTLRGAKIRNSLIWSTHINDAIKLWCDDVEVVFASHHWPTWGKDNIVAYLKSQRDLYRYLHDETLRLANHGYTPIEIAEMIELPDGIAQNFANRGYYGSLNHNVKAIYVYYLGWFDGNPANLHPLPPVETAKKTIEYMGGADAVLDKAREDFAKGEFRWVAQAVNNVVFADPDNAEARRLQADTLEQLGYQAENGTWRDWYLSGAKELRDGVQQLPTPHTASADTVTAMTTGMLLGYLAVRLNGPKAADKRWTFNLNISGPDEQFGLEVENGVLNYTEGLKIDAPTATISCRRFAIDQVLLGQATFADQVHSGAIGIEGDRDAFAAFLGLLDDFEFWFDIVTP